MGASTADGEVKFNLPTHHAVNGYEAWIPDSLVLPGLWFGSVVFRRLLRQHAFQRVEQLVLSIRLGFPAIQKGVKPIRLDLRMLQLASRLVLLFLSLVELLLGLIHLLLSLLELPFGNRRLLVVIVEMSLVRGVMPTVRLRRA